MEDKHRQNIIVILLLLGALVVCFFLNIGYGAVKIGPGEIVKAMFSGDTGVNHQIIVNVRLPRTIVAMLVGMALSLSGVILQGIMGNPLATPNIIGVSSGAGLTALTILVLFPAYYYLVPLGAFVGAFLATMLIYGLAWKDGIIPSRLILAGVAINSIFGAGNNILLSLFPDRLSGAINFMVGGLSGSSWIDVKMVLPYITLGIILTLLLSDRLNILVLGDEVATGLGLEVEKTRLIFILISSLMAGSAVSVAGLLGFVGLIVPHMARMFVGTDHKYLFPASILLGSTVVMGCDLLARILFAPKEIAVGIIMSIIGGPFFLYLLRKKEI